MGAIDKGSNKHQTMANKMTDIFISGNILGDKVYEKIKYDDLKYTVLGNLNYLKDQNYRHLHIFATYTDNLFYQLRQCVYIANKIECIIIHQPVAYEELIKFQRSTNIPIIYVPHDTPDTMIAGGRVIWYWSIIGTITDGLFMPFVKILDDVGIGEEHRIMLGL